MCYSRNGSATKTRYTTDISETNSVEYSIMLPRSRKSPNRRSFPVGGSSNTDFGSARFVEVIHGDSKWVCSDTKMNLRVSRGVYNND